MKLKKLLASILCVAMVLSTMSFSVFAADATTAYEVGFEKTYATLQDALDAAENAREDKIVINLYQDDTLDASSWQTLAMGADNTTSITINGNNNTLTFNLRDSDWSHVTTNNNAKFILNNINIESSGYNSGHWKRYGVHFACETEMNNVTSDVMLGFKANANLNNVTITESKAGYSIWLWACGQEVTIDGLTVETSTGRGIKIGDEDADEQAVTLSLSNATFSTAEKSAILVSSAYGADITVDNVDISGVAADSNNLVWIDEDWIASYDTVDLTGGSIGIESNLNAVALIGTTTYTDLATAMKAAKSGDTVKLVADVDLYGTEWEPVDFAGTFDGQNHVISNLTINKPGISKVGFITSLNGTFKNVTFENPTVTGGECTGVLAGRAGGSASLAENINVTGTIKVETTHSGYARAGVIVGGWAYGNYKNIIVDGTDKSVSYIKHTGGGDGRYVAGIVGHSDDVDSYENCIVKNITISGGWLCGGISGPGPSSSTTNGCIVENIDIGADYSGGMFGWYYGSGSIEDSTIKDVTFTAGSTCNGAIGGYQHNSEATISNVSISNVKNSDGTPLLEPEAKIGDHYYASLEAAAEASDIAGANVVIDIIADITLDTGIQFTEATNVTINGNGHTITMVDNPDDNNYSNPHEATERPTGFSISNDTNNSEEEGSVFNINNMTIVNEKTINRYSSGHSWRAAYYAYAYAETTNYTNVNFVGGVSVAQNASFEGCTFTEDRENMFMVFVDQEYSKEGEEFEVSVANSTFNFEGNAYGTFKAANKNAKFNLSVTNSTFNNAANIPAITVDANVDSIVTDCEFIHCSAGSYGSEKWDSSIGGPVPAVPTSGSLNGVAFAATSTFEDVDGNINAVNTVIPGEITIGFVQVEPGLYNIVIDAEDDIYEFVGAELTFKNESTTFGNEYMNYEILGINGATNAEKSIKKADTYALRLVDGAERMSGKDLVIGQVKFFGQGDITFTVSEGKVVTTQYGTNLGQYYTVDEDVATEDNLIVEGITNDAVEEVTRTVVVNVAYMHALDGKYWKDAAGNAANQITVTLKDGFGNIYGPFDVSDKIETIPNVKLGRLTVTLEAPGFRKYVYNTTLEAGAGENDALVLNFWNDIKRNTVQSPLAEIEAGVSGETDKNFVVGDIVMDYTVDEYDLAAVTSYYGMYKLTDADKYIKYDLNRDGNIDIIDVHYVLHTLNN